MKLRFKQFRSRVALRVSLLFLLAALIPMAAMAFLSFSQVSSVLTQEAYKNLGQESKRYGMSIYERLTLSNELLKQLANRLERSEIGITLNNNPPVQFTSIYLLFDSNDIEPILGNSEDLSGKDFARVIISPIGKTSLSVMHAPGQSPQIYLSQRVSLAERKSANLVAELNPKYLWGSVDEQPFSIEFCVTDSSLKTLFCPSGDKHPLRSILSDKKMQNSSGGYRWNEAGGQHIAGSWSLFLEASFNYPEWNVIAIQQEETALAAISAFKKSYPFILTLSLLTILLLSINQISRILVPLDKLTQGIKKISRNDFSTRVAINSGDEFELLGHSFNRMSNQLGKQFGALASLAKIDGLILSSADAESILDAVSTGISEAISCDFISIASVDHDSPNTARIFIKSGHDNEHGLMERILVEDHELEELVTTSKAIKIEKDKPIRTYIKSLRVMGAINIIVFPILQKGTLRGALSLGFINAPSLDEEDYARATNFANRLAVAFASVEREEQLFQQAYYDDLTGLPNRHAFKNHLLNDLHKAKRDSKRGCVLFIDLDNFKKINDSQGHSAGDQLLKETATRIQQCLRETDLVSRLGGDEFAVALYGISGDRDIHGVASKIIASLAVPFILGDRENYLGASIGISIFIDDGDNPEALLMNADTALYQAKEQGHGRYVFYQQEMNQNARNRVILEADLAYAVQRNEFYLQYQPQVALNNRQVIGAEALIRWNHPQRGFVSPGEFIPIVEESALVLEVGSWVLREACTQFMNWQNAGTAPQRIAVNVSIRQFMDEHFIAVVSEVLNDLQMPAECLELEITETLLVEDIENIILTLDKLSKLGVHIALDDFGTGYSSLNYLSRFPIDILKIDKSFIDHSATNENDRAIVKTIIAMAQSLGKETIAEGVEDAAQLALLEELECDYIQGYYFSRPLLPDEFMQYFIKMQSNALDRPRIRQASA
jgi:diguanylate cyclase (GGDEF)-like protein